MDKEDNVTGEESRLLISATSIGIYEVDSLLKSFGGVAIPAHIDRPSFALLSNLGFYDPALGFSAVEVTDCCDRNKLVEGNPELAGFPYIINSDAHSLVDIRDAKYAVELAEKTTVAVLATIRKGQLIGNL